MLFNRLTPPADLNCNNKNTNNTENTLDGKALLATKQKRVTAKAIEPFAFVVWLPRVLSSRFALVAPYSVCAMRRSLLRTLRFHLGVGVSKPAVARSGLQVLVVRSFSDGKGSSSSGAGDAFTDKAAEEMLAMSQQKAGDAFDGLAAAGFEVAAAATDASSVANLPLRPDGFPMGHTLSNGVMRIIEWLHTGSNYYPAPLDQFLHSNPFPDGMPYWQAIAVVTITTRVLMLPLAIRGMRDGANMQLMRPKMQLIQEEMMADPQKEQRRSEYEKKMRALFKEHNTSPLRPLLIPMAQIPIFFAFFVALKDMGDYYPGLATGGFSIAGLNFENLALADATVALPLLNAALFLAMVQIGADGMPKPQPHEANNLFTPINLMRGLAVAMVPMTMMLPSGLFVYWSGKKHPSLHTSYILSHSHTRAHTHSHTHSLTLSHTNTQCIK